MNVQETATKPRSDPAADPPDRERHGAADPLKKLRELSEYVGYYISAQIDSLKLTLTRIIVYAVLGVIGALAAASALVVAVVLVCVGIAHALDRLLSSQWAGELIVGLFILLAAFLGATIGVNRLFHASAAATKKRYEARRKAQGALYGHDVADQAAEGAKHG